LKHSTSGRLSVHIRTYGCQMNKYDSELVSGILTGSDFHIAETRDEADVLLINTCGVREHAENRALADIDRMLSWKKQHSGRIVGMIGCLSVLIGEELLKNRPDIDFVIGPDAYRQLPELLRNAANGEGKTGVLIADPTNETYGDLLPKREPGVRAWLAVSRGCDNACSYCMVPLARGRVRNRPVDEIVNETKTLVAEGYAEVILLGQNANAYNYNGIGFGELLRRIARVPGLQRVRFLTSHPRDLDDDLIDALSTGGNICPDLHLPVQSGSDRILKAMNRGYTRAHYLKLVEKLRYSVPEIALSTDFIVGFPGETEEDFHDTLSLVEEIGFASGFVFRYSPRPGTAAFDWTDDVGDQVKTVRLMELNEALENTRSSLFTTLVGEKMEVLIEGTARKHPEQVTGRSRQGYIVSMPAGNLRAGEEVRVLIREISGFTLLGNVV